MPTNILDFNSPQIEQPANFTVDLYQHQKALVKFMIDLEKEHKIITSSDNGEITIETKLAFLSSRVGSGKTYVVLALINHDTVPTNFKNMIYSQSRYFSISQKNTNTNNQNSNLIIVPHTIIHQWIESIKLISIDFYTVNSKKTLNNYTSDTPSQNQIILVSSTFLTKFKQNNHLTGKWSRVIIDEPHVINFNPIFTTCGSQLDFNFIWFLCATPNQLLYSRKPVVKTIFGSYYCDISHLCVQASDQFIDFSENLEAPEKHTIKCFTPLFLKHYGNDLPKKVTELIEAGSFNEAMSLLDCKSGSGENVVSGLTDYYEKKKHNLIVRRDYINGLIITNQERNIRLKPVEEKIKDMENKIKGIKDRVLKFKEDSCAICVNKFTHPMVTPCCQNVFCFQCIMQSQGYTKDCPMCRQAIDISKLVAILDQPNTCISENNQEKKVCKPSKNEALVKLLTTNESNNKKTLVFSKYDSTFTSIMSSLSENELKYELLKGSNASIKKSLDKFNSGITKIILLNSENMGSGLNLHMATDIIIYHNLNHELEKQVIGRANRVGRQGRLKITYLKYDTE